MYFVQYNMVNKMCKKGHRPKGARSDNWHFILFAQFAFKHAICAVHQHLCNQDFYWRYGDLTHKNKKYIRIHLLEYDKLKVPVFQPKINWSYQLLVGRCSISKPYRTSLWYTVFRYLDIAWFDYFFCISFINLRLI